LVPISGLLQPYPLITLLSRRKFLQTELVPTASTWDKPGRPNPIAEEGQSEKQFTFGRSKCNPLQFQLESGVLLMSPDIRIFQGIDSGLVAIKWNVQIRHFVNRQVGKLLCEENCSGSDGAYVFSFFFLLSSFFFLLPCGRDQKANGFHGMAFLVGVPERKPPIKTSEMT
jgi:hypothetical protein